MSNTFVKIPKRGDVCVKDFATKTPQYISLETFALADLDTSLYEVVGIVYMRKGKKVGVVYKETSSLKFMNRVWWYLSGMTLDGTDQTGVISIRTASSTGTSIDKTISYNASTVADFVSQLNTAFLADSDFETQDWYANVEDDGETVRVHCNFTFYQQHSNSAKSGFTLSSMASDIVSLASMRRKHGGKGGDGAISNLAKAIARYTSDQSAGDHNPSTALTNIKTTYPVCLPAYLGTSANVSGDMCKILRDTYGEGEEGWKKYLNSQCPVVPCGYGNMGQKDGKAKTKLMASKTFVSSTVTTESPCCAGADYCYNRNSDTVSVGEFWLPTTEELYKVLEGVTYGTNSDRDSDLLNKGLNAIGGSPVSNGTSWWSCCRYGSNNAWSVYGSGYFFGNGALMYYTFSCVPVSLYSIA